MITEYVRAHCPRCLEQLEVPIVIRGTSVRPDPSDWKTGRSIVTVYLQDQEIPHKCPDPNTDQE